MPSRRQHEGGLRHKGNVERFVRGLYKAGEKRKQDLDEEKREMARVEQVSIKPCTPCGSNDSRRQHKQPSRETLVQVL